MQHGGWCLVKHASPHRSHDGCPNGSSEGQPGRGGAAERDRVALVRITAFDLGLIGDEQQGAVGSGVASGWLPAALVVESHKGGDAGESCSSCKADTGVG